MSWWVYYWVCNAWLVWCQSHGYLLSSRSYLWFASTELYCLLTEARMVNDLPRFVMWQGSDSASISFFGHFPDKPEFPGCHLFCFFSLVPEDKCTDFFTGQNALRVGHPTNGVNTLKETESTDRSQRKSLTGLILLWCTTGLLRKVMLVRLYELCGTVTRQWLKHSLLIALHAICL